jgi:hypothetical protein
VHPQERGDAQLAETQMRHGPEDGAT